MVAATAAVLFALGLTSSLDLAAAERTYEAQAFRVVTASGIDLLAADAAYDAHRHRHLAAAEGQVQLSVVYQNKSYELSLPRARPAFAPDGVIRLASSEAEELVPATGIAAPVFRSGKGALIMEHSKVHAVILDDNGSITVEKTAGSDTAVVTVPEPMDYEKNLRDDDDDDDDDGGDGGDQNDDHEDDNDDHDDRRALRGVDSLAARDLRHRHRELQLLKFDDCWTGQEQTKAVLRVGLAISSDLYAELRQSTNTRGAELAADFAEEMINDANIIYDRQLDVILQIQDVYVQTNPNGAPSWDGCDGTDIRTRMNQFANWNNRSPQGVWHLFTNCYENSGALGVAFKNGLCNRQGFNVGVNQFTSSLSWLIFAHELGHSFGAKHSFENGAGRTGGIMDYGDGTYQGVYQFNPLRKSEICAELQKEINNDDCPAFNLESGCGDGAKTEDEECECPDIGDTDCACCRNCRLKPNAQCAPYGYGEEQCCTSSCQLLPKGAQCSTFSRSGNGFCDAGTCLQAPDCEKPNFGGACGVQPQDQCQVKCFRNGACVNANTFTFRQEPLGTIGGTCADGAGICIDGDCIMTEEPATRRPSPAPTKAPVARSPEECELQVNSGSPAFGPSDNTNSVVPNTGAYLGRDMMNDGRILTWLVYNGFSTNEDAGGSCEKQNLIHRQEGVRDAEVLASTDVRDWIPYIGNGWRVLPKCKQSGYPRFRDQIDLGSHLKGKCCVNCALPEQVMFAKTYLFLDAPRSTSVNVNLIATVAGTVWVNGERVHIAKQCAAATRNTMDRLMNWKPAVMQPGWNTIVVKARAHKGSRFKNENGFIFRVDPEAIQAGIIGPVSLSPCSV
eukprot:scaffold7381_cov310-Pinguiococcus_pyrenoidosus.AAC.3